MHFSIALLGGSEVCVVGSGWGEMIFELHTQNKRKTDNAHMWCRTHARDKSAHENTRKDTHTEHTEDKQRAKLMFKNDWLGGYEVGRRHDHTRKDTHTKDTEDGQRANVMSICCFIGCEVGQEHTRKDTDTQNTRKTRKHTHTHTKHTEHTQKDTQSNT